MHVLAVRVIRVLALSQWRPFSLPLSARQNGRFSESIFDLAMTAMGSGAGLPGGFHECPLLARRGRNPARASAEDEADREGDRAKQRRHTERVMAHGREVRPPRQ